jgi:hypothetical protein
MITKWQKIRQLRTQALQAKHSAVEAERRAFEKLDKADKLMAEAAIYLSNAKRRDELSDLRQKKLDQSYVRFNKAKLLIDRRSVEQAEHDLFARDSIARL